MTLHRYLPILLAVLSIAIGLTSGAFRDAEGFLTSRFLLPLAVALAFLLYGLRFERWARAGFWVVLALFGQAVSLQLVRAGNAIGYQHYAPYHDLLTAQAIPYVLFLVVEAALVLAGLRVHAAVLGGWLKAIGPARLLLVLLVFVLGSCALSADPIVLAAELLFASAVQAVHLGAIGLAMASLPGDARARMAEWMARWLPSTQVRSGHGHDRFALAAAAFVTITCALLAVFSYERHPHVPDEVVYLYHARYFAKGMLAMPVPPVPDAFNLDLMSLDAAGWYSPVPPGWPAVLAIGAFLGAPWLVNPVLNGINVLLAYALVRGMYDQRSARIATVFLAASPWFLFMGMNFMTHTWTLTCALVAAVAVVRLRRDHDAGDRRSLGWAALAGAAIGVLGLIRPLEGLTIAVLLGLWALLASPTRWRLAPALVMTATAVAVVSITFPYNQALAGDPRVFPLMAYTDSVYGPGTNALGFGANRGLGWPGLDPFPGHGVIDVFVNAALNTFMVNIDLLGWAAGSLLPIAILLVSGRLKRADALMLVVILAIVGIHSLYWFSGGPDFGARYWYLMLVPCIVLAARGVEELSAFLGRQGVRDASARTLGGALVLVALTLALYVPWRAIDKYHHYRFMRPDIRRLADRHAFGRSLVLIRGGRHPDFASAAVYNPIDLHADAPVYAWDRSAEVRRAVLEAYADRYVWIIEGPTESRDGYRVVQGPLPARTLLGATGQNP